MPKNRLDSNQERWCELVGYHGMKDTDAVRECWPHLKPTGVWKKVQTLSKNILAQDRLATWREKSMVEPKKILQKFLRSSNQIAMDPDHRQFGHVMSTVAKLSGALEEDKPLEIPEFTWNVTIKVPDAQSKS